MARTHQTDDDPPIAARVKALEAILTEKGLVDRAALDVLIDTYEHKVGPRNGARVVAKAWTDPGFLDWLRRDATAAIASLGYFGRQGEHMQVVENGPGRHNLVPYRARAVMDPRGVLREFGLALGEDVEISVWDSTAEIRYLVIPERPAGTEGWDAERLAELVSRDSMIGVARASAP
jgi:nitrile hydratase